MQPNHYDLLSHGPDGTPEARTSIQMTREGYQMARDTRTGSRTQSGAIPMRSEGRLCPMLISSSVLLTACLFPSCILLHIDLTTRYPSVLAHHPIPQSVDLQYVLTPLLYRLLDRSVVPAVILFPIFYSDQRRDRHHGPACRTPGVRIPALPQPTETTFCG